MDTRKHVTTIHYDAPVEVFRAFLDPYLKYGCGYYAELDETDSSVAALRQLDRAIDFLKTRDGCSILDVGFGWGSQARRCFERLKPSRYVGINPSGEQSQFVRNQPFGPYIEFVQSAFEDASISGKFDAIFVNDSFCHLKNKQDVFVKAGHLLKDGGKLLIQDTFFVSERTRLAHASRLRTNFVQHEVFGFADLCTLSAAISYSEDAGLTLGTVECLTWHYPPTIAAWIKKLEAMDHDRFPQAQEYIRYLKIGIAGLGVHTGHYLLLVSKPKASRKQMADNLRTYRR